MSGLKVLSLFDGISTGRLALEKLGIPIDTYYTSEIDENAIAISDYHYPDNVKLGDVTKIDFKSLSEIDLLIGGFPCINLSCCGDRKGLEGDYSRLFWECVRALNECKPKYFFFENVESMTSDDMEIISKEFGCYPCFLNSAVVSAQWRKRYYWFNFGKKKVKLLGLPTCYVPQPDDKHLVLADILENPVKINRELCLDKPMRLSQYEKSKGQAQRVYSMYGKSVCLNANGGGQGGKTGLYKIDNETDYEIRKPTPIEAERLQCLPDNWTKYGIKNGQNVEITQTNRYKAVGNGWTTDVITHIFSYLMAEIKS